MPLFSFSMLVARSAVSKPATRLYPFEKREPFKAARGHIVIDVDKCTFCTLCEKRCPTDAIAMERAKRTWTIDRLRCIQCSACVDACNKDCLSVDVHYPAPMTAKAIETFVQPPKPNPPQCAKEAEAAKPAAPASPAAG